MWKGERARKSTCCERLLCASLTRLRARSTPLRALRAISEEEEEEEEEEEGLFKASAVNEEDPERDRATQEEEEEG